jgi:error-prone DNA polymerase
MLAYASTWLKVHFPAEFYASLLNNQPLGFYSPSTLLQDGRRHGLKSLPVCVAHSNWLCTVEALPASAPLSEVGCAIPDEPGSARPPPQSPPTLRIGLRFIKGIRESAVRQLLAARHQHPFASLDDFLRRTDFTAAERRALATAGALNGFTQHRRAALWQVEAAWTEEESLFHHFAEENRTDAPLAPMTLTERLNADYSMLELTVGQHPMAIVRPRLHDVTRAGDLKHVPNGSRVTVAGSVICRQRPGTAKGFVFVSLEDETGIANAVVVPDLFERYRLVITQESALKITGHLQSVSGVIHVRAEKIIPLRIADLPAQASHDFR